MKTLRFSLALALAFLAAGAWAGFDWKKKIRPPAKVYSNKAPIATAGVRGLDEPGSEGDVNARDYESVAWMEARGVTWEDVDTFAATGGLER